jgi:hypothetical protein
MIKWRNWATAFYRGNCAIRFLLAAFGGYFDITEGVQQYIAGLSIMLYT